MSKLALLIKTKAKPGKRDEVLHLFETHLQAAAESNDAQEVIFYCYDTTDDDTFYLFELYADQEALQQASQSPGFAAYMQEAMTLLAGPPEVTVTTPVWTKGASL